MGNSRSDQLPCSRLTPASRAGFARFLQSDRSRPLRCPRAELPGPCRRTPRPLSLLGIVLDRLLLRGEYGLQQAPRMRMRFIVGTLTRALDLRKHRERRGVSSVGGKGRDRTIRLRRYSSEDFFKKFVSRPPNTSFSARSVCLQTPPTTLWVETSKSHSSIVSCWSYTS